jgi:hypothetical protein
VKTRLGSLPASRIGPTFPGGRPESVCAMSAVKVRGLGIVLPIIFVAGFVRLL